MADHDAQIGIEWIPANRSERGRGGFLPSAVVIHTTDGTFAGTVGWFDAVQSGVSAHYVVGLDGRVVQMVAEPDTAFHAGNFTRRPPLIGDRDPNLVTVGIELVDDGDPDGVRRSDEQYRAAAQLLGEIAQRWEIPLDHEHVLPHRELNERKRCPGNVDLDRLLSDARAELATPRPTTVCLLPARNAEDDLEEYLDSAASFADAIVALDDGSTDGTAKILESSPLVKVLIRNPSRATYAGWDDGANRRRLLDAAAVLEPSWIAFLDADENLARDDAAALRQFLRTDALPGCAYGLQHHRMWGEGHCDPRSTMIYRVFAFRTGQQLPDQRLHFDPVPASIRRVAWIPTTIRVQHFGARDEAHRLARLDKYREADPSGEYPVDFGGLADRPSEVVPWCDRGNVDVLGY